MKTRPEFNLCAICQRKMIHDAEDEVPINMNDELIAGIDGVIRFPRGCRSRITIRHQVLANNLTRYRLLSLTVNTGTGYCEYCHYRLSI